MGIELSRMARRADSRDVVRALSETSSECGRAVASVLATGADGVTDVATAVVHQAGDASIGEGSERASCAVAALALDDQRKSHSAGAVASGA